LLDELDFDELELGDLVVVAALVLYMAEI